MKYSYYPGCSMEGTGIEYHKSLTYVNKAIGMEFIEIPDWNCCGATAGHSKSSELGAALPARNVALCEQQGLGLDIAVPCAACYSRMKYAVNMARGDENAKLSRLIEMPIKGDLEVFSLLDVYSTAQAAETIKAAIKNPLEGLKVTCYYGCLFSRPTHVTGAEDVENPQAMDEILRMTGAETVDWAFKTECCGGAHHVDLPEDSRPLLRRIYKNAKANGAEAIVTACPLCMMNLDMRQGAVSKQFNENYDVPIYFITELLAVSMGASIKESGINTHFHPAQQLIQTALSGRREA